MYGIFTYIWLIFMVNVSVYVYHTCILWDITIEAQQLRFSLKVRNHFLEMQKK